MKRAKREGNRDWVTTFKPWTENSAFRFAVGTMVRVSRSTCPFNVIVHFRPCTNVRYVAHNVCRMPVFIYILRVLAKSVYSLIERHFTQNK